MDSQTAARGGALPLSVIRRQEQALRPRRLPVREAGTHSSNRESHMEGARQDPDLACAPRIDRGGRTVGRTMENAEETCPEDELGSAQTPHAPENETEGLIPILLKTCRHVFGPFSPVAGAH